MLLQTEKVANVQLGQIETKRAFKWVTMYLKIYLGLGEKIEKLNKELKTEIEW